MEVEQRRLRAMGSDAHVILVDPQPHAEAIALGRLHELECLWSRFLPDSELSRLNTAQGRWMQVSRDTLVLIATMQAASELTDGAYDPTFLHELLALGYTQSVDDPARISISIDLPCPGISVHDVEVDEGRSSARLPDGLALDAGGIGKGLAADLIVGELLAAGTKGALVSIGGDMCAAGLPPDGDAWTVDIADPLPRGAVATRLTVSGGGIATSSTLARRTVGKDGSQHHTIDPTTRRSSATDLASVTVVAGTGWEAEAHATAALISGASGVRAYAAAKRLSTYAVAQSGVAIRSADLEVSGADDRSRAGATQ